MLTNLLARNNSVYDLIDSCFRPIIKAALKNNFSSEAETTEARTPEKQAFLANLRWIAEVIFERRLKNCTFPEVG